MQNLKLLDYTKKRLDDMYLVMYAIKNDVNMKKADIIDNIDIYTIVGINKSIKDKLKLDSHIKIKENIYDTDIELEFTIKDCDKRWDYY